MTYFWFFSLVFFSVLSSLIEDFHAFFSCLFFVEFIHYMRIYTVFCGWKFKYYKPVSFIKFIVVSMM